MTQSPVVQNMQPNMEFIEHYIDSLENLPLDVQRFISQIREYDLLYKNKLEDMGRYLRLYQNEPSGPTKRKYLNKIQKCLIKSQHYGDVKLNLISQIVELVDSRSQLLNKDVEAMCSDRKEEESKATTNNNNNHVNSRIKVEKTSKTVAEKLTKSIYEKPKRIRRVRTADKSTMEKNDRATNNHSRASNKADDDEEEEPMEEEEDEPELKPKKETKKTKEREAKHKDKEREKEREKERSTKEDKEEKEEKKVERKDKHTSGKVIKKSNSKVQSKMKKQKKKKEKEVLPEDIPIDPDEPTYCLCKRISYGDMIGCDNESCDIEWFHFDCVNLTHKPKGKWYCPRCSAERKEKNKK